MGYERFIKLNNVVYYESELRIMPDEQLKDLIQQCKQGIEEIQRKSDDYKMTNVYAEDQNHVKQTLEKFQSASVYLQSDILLINNILKERMLKSNYNDMSVWYKTFYNIAKTAIFRRRFNQIVKITNETVGFTPEGI